jgi:hypothetical protein
MTLGALAFLNPVLLAGLLALPVIYWLLRTVPPQPRRIPFPATRILVGLESPEKTPAKTPWWLMLIRLLAAALVIFALAEPILNPNREKALKGAGPVVLAVDNGWSAAAQWPERMRMIERLINEAEAQSRPVVVVATASPARSLAARVEAPAQARSTAAALQPQPFQPARLDTAAALETAMAGQGQSSVVWLSDGINHAGEARAFADRMAVLAGGGTFVVIEDPTGKEPLAAVAGLGRDGKLEVAVRRVGGPVRDGLLHAYSVRGQRLGEATFRLGQGDTTAAATFQLPLELRNQVTRVEIAGERSAGAVSLLDARSQWHRVGMLSGESREQAQPLLAALYFLQKAMGPFAEIVVPKDSNLAGGIDTLLKQNATVMVMADIGTLAGDIKEKVDGWVKKGGVLVRFAGPRLEKGGDDLLPAPLRLGGRSLGGALSWSTPQPLAAFDEASLFSGLPVQPDVLINRQVLADPARLGTDVKVWARLKDGTPLVTASKRGDGQLVMFHVTANTDWSNLPISGLFVEMLRRIATLGRIAGGGGEATVAENREGQAQQQPDVLSPIQTLDGFGTLRSPPPTAQPIAAAKIQDSRPSLDNPPGYYGLAGAPRALNVLTPQSELKPLPGLPTAAERRGYESETATPLKPSLLSIALALIFVDIVAVLLLQLGGIAALGRRRAATAAGLIAAAALVALAVMPDTASAQTTPPAGTRPAAGARTAPTGPADPIGQRATSKVTFAYVRTGDPTTDDTSFMGLKGLGRELSRRTSVEPGEPYPVNIVNDEIAFFPIIYWPVLANAQSLPEATLNKIDAYMKQGGMIVFDTRDYGMGLPSGMPTSSNRAGTPLQRLLGGLDILRLEAVPDGHVMTKSFYLLRSFPGRWDGGQLWVEADADPGSEQGRKAKRTDGVSSILVTSNDLASAWALDERGRPLYPTVPGGEQQREFAFRTGVNIVMYALTGNYKADQVHVPALLERLGQ